MPSDLERIEEKHSEYVGQCRECRQVVPCDVVKLARAISQYLEEYDTPVPDLLLRSEYRKALRRTLREVAGEPEAYCACGRDCCTGHDV